MNTVRWGLLSTANINRRVIPAIHLSPRGELVAVASRNRETAVAYAEEWHIPQTFASYEAMLQSDAIDAVYIPLPNHLHAEWAIAAMRHGKHVLCEKPFALTLAEVDEMTAVAAETGMVLAEAFMYRHHPQAKIMGEMVRNGRLGEITRIYGAFSFAMGVRDNVRLVAEYGGGALWDVGVYPVSACQYIMGELPQWVFGDQWLGESGVDETFSGQMHYASGAIAQISCGFRSPLHTLLEIHGTNGRLTLSRPFTGVQDPESHMQFFPRMGDPETIAVPDEYLYLGEVEDIHAAILDNAPTYLSLADTRQHVQTVLALYKSAQTQQVVALD